MEIKDIEKRLEKEGEITWHGVCHDCGTAVTVSAKVDEEGRVIISGGAVYDPEIWSGGQVHKEIFLKCDKCYQADSTLRDYQPCEVYSRVVGYLRPVSQWNVGKREEFKLRKTFVVE